MSTEGIPAPEVARRYWSDELRLARKRRTYQRQATVPELDRDLAVLRAIAKARQRQRSLCGWLAIAALVGGGLALASLRSRDMGMGGPIIVVAVGAAVLLTVARALLKPYPRRRIDLASAVLRHLAADPHTTISLTLDLGNTQRRQHLVTTQSAHSLGGMQERTRYANPWLKLEATLAGGDQLCLVRTEHLVYREQQVGARSTFEWSYAFEDDVELGLAAPQPPLTEAHRRAFALPEGLALTQLDGDAHRRHLALCGDRVWDATVDGAVPAHTLDAVPLTVGCIASLATLTGGRASISSPTPAALASVSIWSSRGFAVGLGVLSLAPAIWAAVRWSDFRERSLTAASYGMPLNSVDRVAREAAASGGIALGLWASVALLWVVPARRARPKD